MHRQFIFIIFASLLTVSGACQKPELDIFTPIFEAHGSPPDASTMVIKRLSDNKVWIGNAERADTRFIPASTSKIPHTLIALETKQALPETLFKWDGQERTFKSWNQNQTLTQAYRRSAVWVYQEITHSLGRDVMTSWLTDFKYGNHELGSDDNVTQYWLSGPLKISALEQVDFLTKLSKKELSLSPETYQKSWVIFKNKTKGTHILYAKTGWMYDEKAIDLGWFVGWVETRNPSETYVFAFNMDMPNQGDQKKRKPIVMNALQTIGAWPE